MKTFEFGPDTPGDVDPQGNEDLLKEADEALKVGALVRIDRNHVHYQSDNGSADLTLCNQQRRGPHAPDPLQVTCSLCWNLLADRRLVPRSTEMVQVTRPQLTPGIAQGIIDSVSNGNAPETSAALHGISKKQLMDWLLVGSRLIESDAVYFTPDEALMINFTLDLRRAVAAHEVNLTQAIVRAGQIPEQWRANTWMLENYHPDRYGKSVKIDVHSHQSDANSGPEVDFSKLSDAELIKLDQMLRKASGTVIDVTPEETGSDLPPGGASE